MQMIICTLRFSFPLNKITILNHNGVVGDVVFCNKHVFLHLEANICRPEHLCSTTEQNINCSAPALNCSFNTVPSYQGCSPVRSSSEVVARLARLQTSLRAANTNLWALRFSPATFTFRSLQNQHIHLRNHVYFTNILQLQ